MARSEVARNDWAERNPAEAQAIRNRARGHSRARLTRTGSRPPVDLQSPEMVELRERTKDEAAAAAARMYREGMLPRWHGYGAKAPGREQWLRKATGAQPSRTGAWDEAESGLEATIAAGEGFDDLDILEYAYVSYREQWVPEHDVDPFDAPKVVPIRPLELLGVAEVCALLGLKRMQLKRLRDAGKFPEPMAELAAGPIWNADQLPERGEA